MPLLLAATAAGALTTAAQVVQAASPSPPPLSAAQRDTIERGGAVLVRETRAGTPWPAVTAFVFIHATPEEAAAVFIDVERHASYIPSVTRSRIAHVVDSATIEVDYTLAMPIVSDEQYTIRDHVTRDGNRYRVDWTLVRASTTRATVGHALFLPWTNARTGRAGTLIEYHNFVTPGSRLAGLGFIRNRAVDQVLATARAVARQAETDRGDAALMRRLIERLRSAAPASIAPAATQPSAAPVVQPPRVRHRRFP